MCTSIALHYAAALLSLLLFCQSVMVDEFCCLLPVQQSKPSSHACQSNICTFCIVLDLKNYILDFHTKCIVLIHLYADCLCLIEPDCHCVNWNDGFWVKVRVFPRTFIVVWDLYSVLDKASLANVFEDMCFDIADESWCCPPDIDALHWYWCRWTDADTLMLLFCCLLLWTRTHLPLQRKTCKVALLCATRLWKSASGDAQCAHSTADIFTHFHAFIHFHPLSSFSSMFSHFHLPWSVSDHHSFWTLKVLSAWDGWGWDWNLWTRY